jgi:hypothetical protein
MEDTQKYIALKTKTFIEESCLAFQKKLKSKETVDGSTGQPRSTSGISQIAKGPWTRQSSMKGNSCGVWRKTPNTKEKANLKHYNNSIV